MNGTVLVVDDNPSLGELVEAILFPMNYDLHVATRGDEALAMLDEIKPDVMLLDVMMPGMDGFETCRQLKEDLDVSHIPVVMVTALSDAEDRVRGLDAGADDFLTKPVDPEVLDRLITRYLGR